MVDNVPKKRIIYPNNLLYKFLKKAQNRRDPIAYVVGYHKGDFLVANEMVFPNESCLNSKVSQFDKKDFGKLPSTYINAHLCNTHTIML